MLNYLDVAETAFTWNEAGRPWSTSSVGELHRLLMAGTASERECVGVRPIQVVIGRRDDAPSGAHPIEAARFVPAPPGDMLASRVADLLVWMQTDHRLTIDPVVAAAMGHYTFEALHPFHDGSGRIGRLFIVLQLHRLGVLSEPTISVSPWFEARRQRYYDALLGVSTTGDWSTWVALFAEGLAASADETRLRMLALTDVQATLKDKLQRSALRTANARVLIDFAVARPTFTVAQAARALGIKYQGTTKLISSLVHLGILAEYGQRSYNRRFHAPLVLDVLLHGPDRAGKMPT